MDDEVAGERARLEALIKARTDHKGKPYPGYAANVKLIQEKLAELLGSSK